MNPTDRIRRTAGRKARRGAKHLLHLARSTRPDRQRTLCIVGCQRSGTSMVADVLERDWRTRVFYEFSSLSSDSDYGLRLNPLDNVRQQVERTRAPIVITKPLVESQRISEVLDAFHTGFGLWMFRDHDDVISSNLKRWGDGNGFSDLEPILAGDPENWRSAGATQETTEMIRERVKLPLMQHDAAALFWLARNQLFFDQDLAADSRVLLCNYENLTADPRTTFDEIFHHMGCEPPSNRALSIVRTTSVGKGRAVELSDDIRQMCDVMTGRLRAASAAKSSVGH